MNAPEPVTPASRAERAKAHVTECLAGLERALRLTAVAKLKLEVARNDRAMSSTDIGALARDYRSAEEQMYSQVDRVISAHIATIDALTEEAEVKP